MTNYTMIMIIIIIGLLPLYVIYMARYLDKKEAYKLMKIGKWQKGNSKKAEMVSKVCDSL